jgi:hypothetical protein
VHAAAESPSAAHCVVFDYTRGTLEISVRTFDRVDSSGPMSDELLLGQTWRRGWRNRGSESVLLVMGVSDGNGANTWCGHIDEGEESGIASAPSIHSGLPVPSWKYKCKSNLSPGPVVGVDSHSRWAGAGFGVFRFALGLGVSVSDLVFILGSSSSEGSV